MDVLTKKTALILALFLAVTILSCSDDDDENVPVENTVELKSNATLGQYLADENGMALYYFINDFKGASTCNGGCLSAWPAFYKETIKTEAGLNAADFRTITRTDGAKQTTFKGWPLYYFGGDTKPGEVNGDDQNKVWYVAKPDYSLMVGKLADEGEFMVDAAGKTLYKFTNDTENISNCKDGCVSAWPLFLDETLVLPSFFSADDFNTITREDGAKQTTFRGMPLYYFAQDQVRGDMKGQGSGGKWFIITDVE